VNITAWLKSKNLTSHTVAAGAIALAGLIMADQQVRDFIISASVAHPKIGAGIIALAGIILKYSHSSSPAGTVATAEVIQASPNAPSPSAVEAAKGK
jgi:hypothetical protein